MKSRMPWATLHGALEHVGFLRRLNPNPTTHRQRRLAAIEGLAHELAHQFDAGRNFEYRLIHTANAAANEHEAATLRIEVAALAALGARVSLRNLWRDAAWKGPRPALTPARRVLSARERKCVAAFVRIVRETVERLRQIHAGSR